jgi:hypothetical protein
MEGEEMQPKQELGPKICVPKRELGNECKRGGLKTRPCLAFATKVSGALSYRDQQLSPYVKACF